VHGLHPQSLAERVEGALATVRPLLGAHGGDVELLEIDEDAGGVRLRLLGSCDGCPSSAITLQSAVERAIVEAAPEIVAIDVDAPDPTPSTVAISLTRKAATYTECPAEMVDA
jgi:Fe-S cluster biogenesis protein NfuA